MIILSDKEIEDLYFTELDNRQLSFARAIEAKVIEKITTNGPIIWMAESGSTVLNEEIARLQKVIAKCKEVLISNISDLQEPNFVTLAAWRVREALAAIKEEGL